MKLYNKYFLGLTIFFISLLAVMTQTEVFLHRIVTHPVSFLSFLLSSMIFLFLIYICLDNHQFSLLAQKTKETYVKELKSFKESQLHFKKLKRKTNNTHIDLLEKEVSVKVLEKKLSAVREISKGNLVLTRNFIILGLFFFFFSVFSASI